MKKYMYNRTLSVKGYNAYKDDMKYYFEESEDGASLLSRDEFEKSINEKTKKGLSIYESAFENISEEIEKYNLSNQTLKSILREYDLEVDDDEDIQEIYKDVLAKADTKFYIELMRNKLFRTSKNRI